ncbi:MULTISPECIES: helix-turn-helix transcriptional regulator [Pseudomonas syringae group]|uniref:Transcriptional regulator PrtR n=2 Tax=Pseudomonas syringae group TaxID=136849 RepID=A0A0Q0A8T9_PSESX|nr:MULTISPECIES: S24 family peptidase [Pseudomonas syringae group]KPY70307.1 Transcriptional regulator PrtR [Pseudomonas syringae pv. spinaceae]MCF5806042.1 helix-turn-helix transcriptional regulator [Pseudomonas tremae]MCF5810990.1 helix-turn-helix transcriptional regulator [Pseudomonas tremae]
MSKQPLFLKGQRFRQALADSGLTGAEFARVLDLDNEQNITNWKSRGVPAYMAGEVARTLVVERDWLEGKDVPMRTDTTARNPTRAAANEPPLYVLEPLAPWDSDTPLENDEVELRLYKEVELSSGPGKVARTEVQEVSGPKLRFSRATMRTCGVDPSNAVFATNNGDSNHPLILSGATVGIDTGMTRIIDGEIYAIDHDGHFRIKFLQRLPAGIRMKSFNSSEYADEDYEFDDILAQRIVILGRIFWWSSIRPLKGPSLI